MRVKQRVLEEILRFASEYVSLSTARLATLGGEGLEADLWETRGIQGDHGWLIERSPRQIRGLLKRSFPYRILHGRLGRFPNILRGQMGRRAGLDLFHWDLCGTVEPAITELTKILPLVAVGRGKCLAITMADKRENRSIREAAKLRLVCERVFGESWGKVWEAVVRPVEVERSIRPNSQIGVEAAATREAGALFHLLLALSAIEKKGSGYIARERGMPLSKFLRFRREGWQKDGHVDVMLDRPVRILPDRIVRCLYVTETGFRMRSLLFHLKVLDTPVFLREASMSFAEILHQSTVFFLHGSEMISMSPAQVVLEGLSSEQKGVDMNIVDKAKERLEPLRGILDPETSVLLDQVIQLARVGERIAAVAGPLVRALQDVIVEPVVAESVAPNERENSEELPRKTKRRPRKSKNGNGVQTHSGELKDEIRLALVKARSEGEDVLAEARKEAEKRLGIAHKKNRGRVVGSLIATATGGFRAQFVGRVLARLENPRERQAKLKELADAYGESPQTLKREAGL